MQEATLEQPSVSIHAAPRTTEYPWMSVDEWWKRHEQNKRLANSQSDVTTIFYGDSIIQAWANSKAFEPYKQQGDLALGIGGDTTENLLWRIQHGETGQLQPKNVVVLIGINDFGHQSDTPKQVAEGVIAVATQLRDLLQPEKLIVVGILPSGRHSGEPIRDNIGKTNSMLSGQAKSVGYKFADIGSEFLEADGSISAEVMADFLHPTERGYGIFAAAIDEFLKPVSK